MAKVREKDAGGAGQGNAQVCSGEIGRSHRAADSHEALFWIAIDANVSRQAPDGGRHPRKPENDHHYAFEKAPYEKNRHNENDIFPRSNVTRYVKVDQACFQ